MDELWKGVPEFPEFKALGLEDKPLLGWLFTRFPPVISDFTFTNLFIWRMAYQIKISRFQNFLCLLSEKEEAPFFYPPVGEGEAATCYRSLLDYLGSWAPSPIVARVPEQAAVGIDWKALGMKAEPDRKQWDYVYLTRDLIELKGRKYHRKRNHIKQFQEKNDYQYVSLSPAWIPQCLQLHAAWCDLRDCESHPGLRNESFAIREAFLHFETLGMKGGALLIRGKVEAFTLGERLNPETVVVHIEKANPKIDGLYPVINQAFLEKEWTDMTYVNREQDLGEEGLRKAKESYYPDHMINKYIITLGS